MMRKLNSIILVIYLTSLGFVVLTPNDGDAKNSLLWFLNVDGLLHDFLNFLLLTPLPLLINWVIPNIHAIYLLNIGSILSAIIEVLQRWIPGRDPSLLDFLLNSAGSLLIGIYVVSKKANARKSTTHTGSVVIAVDLNS